MNQRASPELNTRARPGGLHRQKSINGPEKGAGGSVGRRMSLKEKERGKISPGTLGRSAAKGYLKQVGVNGVKV